jgi:hypothetical protein
MRAHAALRNKDNDEDEDCQGRDRQTGTEEAAKLEKPSPLGPSQGGSELSETEAAVDTDHGFLEFGEHDPVRALLPHGTCMCFGGFMPARLMALEAGEHTEQALAWACHHATHLQEAAGQ